MKSREMMDEKGTNAPARSADEDKASAVRDAAEALNGAIQDAVGAGLKVEVDLRSFEYLSGTCPVVSASVSRAL